MRHWCNISHFIASLSLYDDSYQIGTTFEQIIHVCLFLIVSDSFTSCLTCPCVCKLQGWVSAQWEENQSDD